MQLAEGLKNAGLDSKAYLSCTYHFVFFNTILNSKFQHLQGQSLCFKILDAQIYCFFTKRESLNIH
jgi:hypothetical protein